MRERKLKSDELLIGTFAASRLRLELDRVPLWRADHVALKQFIEDFARYLYLPRLQGPAVLSAPIRGGIALLTWEQNAFAYADEYDEAGVRHSGLRGGQHIPIQNTDSPGVLVRPAVARVQLDAEAAPTPRSGGAATAGGGGRCTRDAWTRRHSRTGTGGTSRAAQAPALSLQRFARPDTLRT